MQENVTAPEHSDPSVPPPDIATLADLLTALPDSDRADVIAGLLREHRLAVAKLIAARITEDNTHD